MKEKIFSFLVACVAPLVSHSADAQKSPKIWRLGLFHVGLDHVSSAARRNLKPQFTSSDARLRDNHPFLYESRHAGEWLFVPQCL